MSKKIIISTLVATVILFLWSGITQMFPWGVPTAQAISAQSSKKTDSFQTPNLIELPSGTLTTAQFDAQMQGKISTLTTDQTFSWIISTSVANYDPMRYFAKEIFTQFFIAFLLSLLLFQLKNVTLNARLTIVAIFGIMAVAAIYGQQMNWWSMPAKYALGAGFNLVVGWLLATFVLSKWIIKTE